MNTAAKVAGFTAGLALLFGTTYAVGSAVGTVGEPAAAHDEEHSAAATNHDGGESDHVEHGDGGSEAEVSASADVPGGLMSAQEGYQLVLADSYTRPGRDRQVRFAVTGPDGEPVENYEKQHEKELHLVAVRRDFTGFQHVHPVLGSDGTWRTRLDLTAGDWRVFADFQPIAGPPLTLGSDLAVAGRYEPRGEVPEERTARVGGYTVTLTGDLVAGADAKLTLAVSRAGQPVTDLQPYLGAYGHLVALREGDLAYLHVHPDGSPDDGHTEPGPAVVFYAAVPSNGDYHLYLDFKHEGVVRTAAFDLSAGEER